MWHFTKRQLCRFVDLNIFFSRRFERRHLVGGRIQPSRWGHLSVKFLGDSRRFAGRWRRRHGTDTPSVATLLSINKSTADVRQRPFYFSAGCYGRGLRRRNPCKVNRAILYDILTSIIYRLFFILSQNSVNCFCKELDILGAKIFRDTIDDIICKCLYNKKKK